VKPPVAPEKGMPMPESRIRVKKITAQYGAIIRVLRQEVRSQIPYSETSRSGTANKRLSV